MITYFNELKKDDVIYSIDMVRYSFNISFVERDAKELEKFIKYNYGFDYRYFYSNKQFSFRHLFSAENNGQSFALGFHFNGVRNALQRGNGFIEFNPNKSFNYVLPLLNFLKLICRVQFIELERLDFAIDLPCNRGYVFMLKDKRTYNKYKLRIAGVSNFDYTEYLGKRHNNGYVKLYNKSIESNLSYDLTRLEITLDRYNYENFIKQLPTLCYYSNSLNIGLSSTERVLIDLMATNNSWEQLKFLERDKQNKLKHYLDYSETITINENEFSRLVVK